MFYADFFLEVALAMHNFLNLDCLFLFMLEIKLSEELEKEYFEIKSKFETISDSWKKYNDEIIPEDKEFAKKILTFIISVIDYIIKNYDDINLESYRDFLAYYDMEFFYGPSGDERNYLSFDENIGGESVVEFCWVLKDDNFNFSKENLNKIKKKYEKVLSMF